MRRHFLLLLQIHGFASSNLSAGIYVGWGFYSGVLDITITFRTVPNLIAEWSNHLLFAHHLFVLGQVLK